jgi:hypothetical protein
MTSYETTADRRDATGAGLPPGAVMRRQPPICRTVT